MDDCGAVYRVDGEARDPYEIFADYGANLVRVRLWHTPTWTEYSTFDDVVRSFQRANALGMNTMLDFHYSDTWADPAHQTIPAAWADITDLEELGQALYQYTYDTLMELDAQGLMPELVQVGNEINSEILRPADTDGYPIDWERNAYLINEAIRAVRDADAASTEAPRVVIHIAQPDEAEGWLLAATNAGVTDYDIIGLSYYPGWSDHTITTTGNIINRLRYRFSAEVMVVETAYPWTFASVRETAGNIPDADFLLDGYPASPEGQRQFMIDLTQSILNSGGIGVVYWEPAWVSTDCSTLWGQGSHWENATFFDFNADNEVLPAIEFFQFAYEFPVEVTLSFNFDNAENLPEQIYFWGDFTGMQRRMLTLTLSDGAYVLHTRLLPGTTIRYQFYTEPPAAPETALLPAECLDDEGYVSVTIPENDAAIVQTDGACPTVSETEDG
jgi:arabinogalactan endo-1,4-beta-galactosidase